MNASRLSVKLLGAAGAAALAIGAGVGAMPAEAAPVTISYDCAAGYAPLGVVMDLGTLPTTMVAGQTVTQTIHDGVLHLPNQTVQALVGLLGYDNLAADVVSTSGTPYTLTVPATDLPSASEAADPDLTVDIPATGAFTLTATTAGHLDVVAGAIAPTLHGSTAGVAADPFPISCDAPTDGSQDLGSITVVKDASTTSTSAAYKAKNRTATLTAKVKGAKYGMAGTGKVTFTVKKGKKTVKTLRGVLKNGVARASFKAPKNPTKKKAVVPVKYTVKAAFAGDSALKSSAGGSTFTVKK